MKGTVAGMPAAELAAGYESDLLARIRSEAEPSRLLPQPIARIGASLTIRWRELRAGREM